MSVRVSRLTLDILLAHDCLVCRLQATRASKIFFHIISLVGLSYIRCCCAEQEHVAETYFVEPPNWERTDNWRPPASPGNTFYWHDRSWAPECPWDIGRLTKKSLTAPVRRYQTAYVLLIRSPGFTFSIVHSLPSPVYCEDTCRRALGHSVALFLVAPISAWRTCSRG